MPASAEEQQQDLKAEEAQARAELDAEQCRQRDQLASTFSKRWDALFVNLGMRRDRSTPAKMAEGRKRE